MRYPASEKLEIIGTVEGSHLPAKQTLDMLGIPRTTFYRWYDRYVEGGFDALADRSPRPKSVWNRIPQARRDDLIEFALEHEALTARELAVLRLIAQGLRNQEIADELAVSEATVRAHVSRVLGKLHLASRTQAALYAVREGLTSDGETSLDEG